MVPALLVPTENVQTVAGLTCKLESFLTCEQRLNWNASWNPLRFRGSWCVLCPLEEGPVNFCQNNATKVTTQTHMQSWDKFLVLKGNWPKQWWIGAILASWNQSKQWQSTWESWLEARQILAQRDWTSDSGIYILLQKSIKPSVSHRPQACSKSIAVVRVWCLLCPLEEGPFRQLLRKYTL